MSSNNMEAISDLSSPLFIIQSDKDVHFTGALVTGAIENETITLSPAGPALLPTQSMLIWGVALLAVQNLDWRVVFWGTPNFGNADIDLDTYEGACRLHDNMAFQIGGAGTWYYDYHGTLVSLGAPDMTTLPFPMPYTLQVGYALNIGLQNLSAAAKIAGAGGFVSLRFFCQPVGD